MEGCRGAVMGGVGYIRTPSSEESPLHAQIGKPLSPQAKRTEVLGDMNTDGG